MPLIATRIFPSEENPLALGWALSGIPLALDLN